jgi:hypothetical protein
MPTVFYSPGYVGAGYEFDTTRKAKWVVDSLIESPIRNIVLAAPQPGGYIGRRLNERGLFDLHRLPLSAAAQAIW